MNYYHIILVHWRCIHAWAHVYISKQFPSFGTFIAVGGGGGGGGLGM